MLDSWLMTNWRKFLTVVLLMLSLSARAFAGAPLSCELSRTGGGVSSVAHLHASHMLGSASDSFAAIDSAQPHQDSHNGSHNHGSGHCSICASCCFGNALPPVTVVATPIELSHQVAPTPPPVRAARFLTGGIERPPRALLV